MLTPHVTGPLATRRVPRQFESRTRQPIKRCLEQVVDFGLAGVIFVAPLAMGGRHPIGRFILISFVAVVAVAWFCGQCFSSEGRWRWSGAEWIVLAGTSLILIQLVPLPAALHAVVSPHTSDLLPVWSAQADSTASLGSWSRISLNPSETTGGLMMFVAYGTLFLIVVQRIKGLSDVERLLRWVALAATGMAVVGIGQRFAGNGHFLWIYEHPFRDTAAAVKGTFINENHFAHFLALGIAPLLWWLCSRRITARTSAIHLSQVAIGLALAVVGVAGLLTFSRGGVVVMVLAAAVGVAIYAREGFLNRHSLVALAGVGLFVGAALVIHGYAPLSEELASLGAGSVDDVDRFGIRRQLWAADVAAVSQFPLLGTGIGTHADVYPVYFEPRFDLEYTHAENGYLQVLLESGISGLVLLSIGIATCCRWSFGAAWQSASPRMTAAAAVVVATLTISLIHSIWDFVWYLPACMSLTIVIMACGCRLYQMGATQRGHAQRGDASVVVPRQVWAVAALAVSGVAALIIHDRLSPAWAARHWDQYLRQVVALQTHDKADSGMSLDRMIGALQKAIDHDPRSARAHARIANLLMRRFEQRQAEATNPIQLHQLRQAVLASRFPSRQTQDAWMSVAIGDNRQLLDRAVEHVHRALRLCPLQGESYVDLAELAFLEGRGSAASRAFLEQALRVRPHGDDVLFAVGAQLVQSGDVTAAMEHWKAPFQRSLSYRRRIIELLADKVPPRAFIEQFEPDSDGLGDLYTYYRQRDQHQVASIFGWRYAELLELSAAKQGRQRAAEQWLSASDVRLILGDHAGALRCRVNAVQAAPDDYQPHLKLATALIEAEKYNEAIEELNWCQRRRPRDQVVLNCLKRARMRQLRQAANFTDTDGHRK